MRPDNPIPWTKLLLREQISSLTMYCNSRGVSNGQGQCMNSCVWFQQLMVKDPAIPYPIFTGKDWFHLNSSMTSQSKFMGNRKSTHNPWVTTTFWKKLAYGVPFPRHKSVGVFLQLHCERKGLSDSFYAFANKMTDERSNNRQNG
jgi:hypothetical protein